MKLIAETAWHHDGDLIFFKNLVSEISTKTNTDYVKFHITLDVDEYMHTDHAAYSWAEERVFTEKEWAEVLEIPKQYGKNLMLLFNDKKAIDFGMQYDPEIVEIHSVCLNDTKLLTHLKSKINNNTKIVLGVGGTEVQEIKNAISILEHKNIVLMHGFQNFPTKYEDINFNKINKLIELFPEFEHGYADHTAWDNENNVLITLLGASLDMKYIEKHVTTKPGEKRTDWQAAITLDMFLELENKLSILTKAMGNGSMELNSGEKSYSTFGANKKAAILLKSVEKGDKLSLDVFAFKRTGQSSDLSQLDILNNIGKIFTKKLQMGHCINNQDIK